MLNLVTVVFNPRQYKRRYELYRQFIKRVAEQPVNLYTVELAFGDRPFEVTSPTNPFHIQYRSDDEWFIKENLINLGFRRIPKEERYVGWVDCDVAFLNPDWASDTIDMLQHHPVVQIFSQVVNLTPKHDPFQIWKGFGYSFTTGRPYKPVGKDYNFWHPGFGWAYTREAITALGGLLDRIPLGSADSHMAGCLIGKAKDTVHGGTTKEFKDYIYDWENNAQKFLKKTGTSIGYVNGLICHYWHGRMANRKYKERWQILIDHKYDPYKDLRPDLDGLLHLTDDSYGLRIDLQRYLANRDEDCIHFDESESTI